MSTHAPSGVFLTAAQYPMGSVDHNVLTSPTTDTWIFPSLAITTLRQRSPRCPHFCVEKFMQFQSPDAPKWDCRAEALHTSHLANCLPKILDQLPSNSRAGAPLLECKFEPRVQPTELLFCSPPGGLGGRIPWMREEFISWLTQRSTPPLPPEHLPVPGPPEPGTTFTGSELIMSFYELWGPRRTRINVKCACQPRSPGECYTLTKLKAAATPGKEPKAAHLAVWASPVNNKITFQVSHS